MYPTYQVISLKTHEENWIIFKAFQRELSGEKSLDASQREGIKTLIYAAENILKLRI